MKTLFYGRAGECARAGVLAVLLVLSLAMGGGISSPVCAQTFTYQGEIGASGASTERQPFWIRANQYGRIDPTSTNGYVRLETHGRTDTSRVWGVRGGAELLGRLSATETIHFTELYTQFRYRFLRLGGGRKFETVGPVRGQGLSSGSLFQSRHATPLPVVSLETIGFVDVPYTNGFAEVKGHYAHGWFSDDRFVENAYLHRKAAYLRVGAERVVSATMGLVHGAQWGGTAPPTEGGTLPQDGEAYWNVVIAGSAGEEAPEGEQVNALGNHVGIFDLGVTLRLESSAITLYNQHLFEDRSGFDWKNFPDGLYGLRWSPSDFDIVDAIQYEFLFTKKQSGPNNPPGRDDYYNNFVYTTGWSANGNLLGSPLFLFEPLTNGTQGVYSNRLVAHHVGFRGRPTSWLSYRLLATWMRHSGTYYFPFPAPQTQTAFLVELSSSPIEGYPLEVGGAIAVDVGDVFGDRVGLRLGVTYQGEF